MGFDKNKDKSLVVDAKGSGEPLMMRLAENCLSKLRFSACHIITLTGFASTSKAINRIKPMTKWMWRTQAVPISKIRQIRVQKNVVLVLGVLFRLFKSVESASSVGRTHINQPARQSAWQHALKGQHLVAQGKRSETERHPG